MKAVDHEEEEPGACNNLQRTGLLYTAYKLMRPRVHLGNKFHFSEVHGSMNAMGPVQRKCRLKGVTLTLYGTHYVHTSITLRKYEFHFFLYLHVLQPFDALFSSFLCKFANYTAKQMLLSDAFGYYIQQPRVNDERFDSQ